MSTSPEREKRPARTMIGKIIGAHGIKGVLKIHPLTDFPRRFFDMKKLRIERPGKPSRELDVLNVALHEGKGQILVTALGVNDRDAAEELSGWVITVSNEERAELPEGEYWIDSLIGLDVRDMESGDCLGVIGDVMQTGNHDVYQVSTPDGPRMIPAVAEVVREIDLEAGVMKVTLPEGLWD